MTTITDVTAFFKSTLQTLSLPNLTVAGDNYKPKAAESHVRMKIFPNETETISIGINGQRMLRGQTQIDIFVTLMQGYSVGAQLAETIVLAFSPKSSPLASNQIVIYSAWAEATSEIDTYVRFPVFIRWEAFS